jgi:hypothetical protein
MAEHAASFVAERARVPSGRLLAATVYTAGTQPPHRGEGAAMSAPRKELSTMDVQPSRRTMTRRSAALWLAALLALASCSTALAAAGTKHHRPKSQLAGKWKGHYSGAVSGHFTIHWTQTGRKLSGTIKLSNPSGKYAIDGSVRAHKKLKFGAVGVGAKYKGSWSGTTMSGTWTSPQGGGSWSATKS